MNTSPNTKTQFIPFFLQDFRECPEVFDFLNENLHEEVMSPFFSDFNRSLKTSELYTA